MFIIIIIITFIDIIFVADNCVPSCKPYDSCLEEDFGHFAEVRYFQLAAMNIPRDLAERYLQALVLIDENDAEKLIQEGQVVRKETESRVQYFSSNIFHVC